MISSEARKQASNTANNSVAVREDDGATSVATLTPMATIKTTAIKRSFQEPSTGFKDLLSKWRLQDDTTVGKTAVDKSSGHSTSYIVQKSKIQARKDHFIRMQSGEVSPAISKQVRRQPKNVYQQPLAHKEDFKPPFFPHTFAEKEYIRQALSTCVVFDDLTDQELVPLIGAFEKCAFDKGDSIMKQGDPGDYFYILMSGRVSFKVNGISVGEAENGATFGELALLYTCPRAATVQAEVATQLFRVDQMTFRFILQVQTQKSLADKTGLLKGVDFAKHLAPSDITKLSAVMTPRVFQQDEVLVRKGDPGDAFYLLQEGTVLAKDISVGSTVYESHTLGPGEYFGERALVTSEPRAANIVAVTKGTAFSIDKDTFETVLGDMSYLITKAQDRRNLAGVKLLKKAALDSHQLAALAHLISDRSFLKGERILIDGQKIQAAIYFVRSGLVALTGPDGVVAVGQGGYFGEKMIQKASSRMGTLVIPPYEVTASEDTECGVLTLADCRTIFEIDLICDDFEDVLAPALSEPREQFTTPLSGLKKHSILGEGTFGQVWLVSEKENPSSKPYALKIQSKFDLIEGGQATACIREKNIMMQLHHPFIIDLVKTYSDDDFVYLLLSMVQGGELFSIMHEEGVERLPEPQAKFYAICIADALSFIHRSKIAFRDLKPENVLIDSSGYPVLIDFGFAKYVTDKLYTLCGTPGYLPPEVVMTRGHDCSADHWSLGILIYEMITGENPFYFAGMDQMSLFRSIVQDDLVPPEHGVSPEAVDITNKLLAKDPTRRLGSLARGEREIFEHDWFREMDLVQLRERTVPAPTTPAVRNAFDTSCFDDWSYLEDKTLHRPPPISDEDQLLFQGF